MKYLIVITGPTAIGKTALSIKVAQHLGCEILSCDSRQFYREMRIGTAVPEPEELAAAPHHFIQDRSVLDLYTVGDYEKDALTLLDGLYQQHDCAVLVGGSGLYVDAVVQGFDDFPEVPDAIRQQVRQDYETHGLAYLQQNVREKDPDHFSKMDRENPQRLMRVLEVCLASGQPYSAFLGKRKHLRNFIPVFIGLEAERSILYDRINQRVDLMMQAGLLEEARTLHPHKNLNALQTVGYRELFDYFDGKTDLDFAVSEIKKNTRRFAKRQLTWFKRNLDTKWFDFKVDFHAVAAFLDEKLQD